MTRTSKTKWIGLTITAAVFIMVVLSLYYKTGAIYQEMKALNFIPVPQKFTELYFQNPSSLPATVAKGETVSFAFTIHNVEGTSTTYPYVVYFENTSGTKTAITNGQVDLAANASITIPVTYVSGAAASGTVVVDLTRLDQQIDFIVSGVQ